MKENESVADPFTIKEIRSLLEMLEKHEVTEFRLERGPERLWLKRARAEDALAEERRAAAAHPAPIQQVFGQIPAMPAPMASQYAAAEEHSAVRPAPAQASSIPPGGLSSAPTPAEPAAKAASKLKEITSPMVGTFYRRPAVDAKPYVEVGDSVKKGDILCIVEAMKLMNEIECETAGVIREVCLEDGQMVEYGEVLFRIEPS